MQDMHLYLRHLACRYANTKTPLADLEQAREHLADDLEKRVNDGNMDEGNSWPIEQNIDNAIGNVRIASQLVNQAQEAIVSVFPT